MKFDTVNIHSVYYVK